MKKYTSELVNSFYIELFSTDFMDQESVTQNTKTDYIFELDCFEYWFEYLIKTFVEESSCNETQLRLDINNCPDFVSEMKFEYEDLKRMCEDC